MGITFEQINAFHSVAKEGSFSKAGKVLFRTQSAVSIQVARLEDTLGHKLFERTTKMIRLTEAGETFLRYTEAINQLLSEAEKELTDLDKMKKGRLTISTSDTTACYRLPNIIKAYRDKYPGIEITVQNATSLRTIELVLENKVDLGIATLSYLPKDIEVVALYSRADVVICHPKHILAGRKTVLLKDLEQYLFIILDRNCSSRRLLDEVCKKAKVDLSIAMELSSIEVVKSFVAINSGISIVPEVSVQREIAAGELVALQIKDLSAEKQSSMGAIYRKDKYLSIPAHSFLDLLMEKACQ